MIKKWQLVPLILLIVGLAGCGQSGNDLDPAVNTSQEQSSESKVTEEELKATEAAMNKKPVIEEPVEEPAPEPEAESPVVEEPVEEPAPEPEAESPVESMTALEQAEIAFDGNYTVDEIKPKMDEALTLYGLPNTEENYSRAGSTLVTLRKEYGPEEMEILDYMIRSHVEGVDMEFPSAAAISAVFLVNGDE